ncbi:MAG: YesL family protein [Romboutsia sp.]
MTDYKSSGGSSIYNGLNYIYYILGVNICFILSNILFIISILVLKLEFQNIIFFMIALIPTGPSFTALFSVIGKFIREKDIYPFKDYFIAYKLNFKETMKIWSIQVAILLIVIIDIRYMLIAKDMSLILFKPLLLIAGLLVSISIYSYSILSRFSLKTKDLIKLSVFYTFKKLPLSVFNIFVLCGFIYFAFFKSPMLIPLIGGIIGYIIMIGQSSTLKEIEENIIINSSELN